jgi:hypothetical protein
VRFSHIVSPGLENIAPRWGKKPMFKNCVRWMLRTVSATTIIALAFADIPEELKAAANQLSFLADEARRCDSVFAVHGKAGLRSQRVFKNFGTREELGVKWGNGPPKTLLNRPHGPCRGVDDTIRAQSPTGRPTGTRPHAGTPPRHLF